MRDGKQCATLPAVSERFFPSRWQKVGVAAGLVVALCGLGQVVLNATSSGSRIGIGLGAALVVSGALQARQASKMGVKVDDVGISCRSGWLGANGSWSWDEIERAEVFFEPALKNPPEELVAVTTSGDLIRLGRLDGRGTLVDEIRLRVPFKGPA